MTPEVIRFEITRKTVDSIGNTDIKAKEGPVYLTRTQFKTYDAIVNFFEINGKAPSFREIEILLDLKSTGVVSSRITRLTELGCFSKGEKGQARSYIPIIPRGFYLPKWKMGNKNLPQY